MATQHGHAGGEYQLEMLQCKLCGDSIHFDDLIVSERTGKKIPLDEGSDYPTDANSGSLYTGNITSAIIVKPRSTLTRKRDSEMAGTFP